MRWHTCLQPTAKRPHFLRGERSHFLRPGIPPPLLHFSVCIVTAEVVTYIYSFTQWYIQGLPKLFSVFLVISPLILVTLKVTLSRVQHRTTHICVACLLLRPIFQMEDLMNI